MGHIVAKCMVFISVHVVRLELGPYFPFLLTFRREVCRLLVLLCLSTSASIFLTRKFPSSVSTTDMVGKEPEGVTHLCRQVVQYLKCEIRVHAQFGKTMPMSTKKQKLHDRSLMLAGEEPIKDRNGTLEIVSRVRIVAVR